MMWSALRRQNARRDKWRACFTKVLTTIYCGRGGGLSRPAILILRLGLAMVTKVAAGRLSVSAGDACACRVQVAILTPMPSIAVLSLFVSRHL